MHSSLHAYTHWEFRYFVSNHDLKIHPRFYPCAVFASIQANNNFRGFKCEPQKAKRMNHQAGETGS
ncbi:hypothetical protein U9M48_011013 [Paspalum notatum var. saurae]|uniref:Uncharacterized protein n=1 Tax=Paspalum notatum var. saurae TaxID=547442 RepID=A0AAQ3SWB0_PASNO